MQKRLFIKNTLILTATALILRSVGIFFRIYLSNAIGAEGMGLYQLIFSVYTLMSVLASAGFNISVTKLVSANESAGRRIMGMCFKLSVILSLIVTIGSFLLADVIAVKSIGYEGAGNCIRILSLGLVFISLSACLKGYFTARRKVSVASNSQFFEQIVRMGIIFYLLYIIPHGDIYKSCIAVVIGNAVSEVAAFVFLYVKYKSDIKKTNNIKTNMSVIGKLLYIFIPTTLSSYLNTILHTYENLIVPDAIFRFCGDRSIAVSLFGMIKGMAIPVIFFPASFLNAVSTMLLPEISSMNESKNTKSINKTISLTVHITLVGSVLIAAVFFVCGNDIADILYSEARVGHFLKMLSVAIPFMYTESIIAGTLSALDLHIDSLKFNIYNSIVRIALILTVVPRYGIDSFIYIMILSNIFTSGVNFIWLHRKTDFNINIFNFFLKPAAAAVTAIMISEKILCKSPLYTVCVRSFVITIVYIAVIIMLRGLDFKSIDFIKRRFREK